jgi:hypothetical protein
MGGKLPLGVYAGVVSYVEVKAVLGVMIGLGLIIFAPSIRRDVQGKREARLAELADGAPEQYFEERRQLEAYSLRRNITLRLLGCFLVICGVAVLLLE